MAWKYVILDYLGLFEFPIIFPDKLVHSEVALAMMSTKIGNNCKIVSAGTIQHLTPEVVGGESTTLGIKSRPEDSDIIFTYPYTHGVVGGVLPPAIMEKLKSMAKRRGDAS